MEPFQRTFVGFQGIISRFFCGCSRFCRFWSLKFSKSRNKCCGLSAFPKKPWISHRKNVRVTLRFHLKDTAEKGYDSKSIPFLPPKTSFSGCCFFLAETDRWILGWYFWHQFGMMIKTARWLSSWLDDDSSITKMIFTGVSQICRQKPSLYSSSLLLLSLSEIWVYQFIWPTSQGDQGQ